MSLNVVHQGKTPTHPDLVLCCRTSTPAPVSGQAHLSPQADPLGQAGPVLDLLRSMSKELSTLRREVEVVKQSQSSLLQSSDSEEDRPHGAVAGAAAGAGTGKAARTARESAIHAAGSGSKPTTPPLTVDEIPDTPPEEQGKKNPTKQSQSKAAAWVPLLATAPVDTSASTTEPDSTRMERWNTVVGAVKANLPHMLRVVASPRKSRRIPDRLDPEPRAQPVRLPLHPAITSALEACQQDIKPPKGGDLSKDTPKLNPDRQAPRAFFKPEGYGDFYDPAKLDPTLRDLQKSTGLGQAQLPTHPNSVELTEAEVLHREQTARVLLCIESSRRWLEDAAIETAETLEAEPATAEWGRALAELLGMMRSLSTLTLDRLTTELVNNLLTRRDMWLRTLDPVPRGKCKGLTNNHISTNDRD